VPRYEFSEGSSNKFWEIKLSGTSFTTTYGKIGTAGSTSLKTFASEAVAKKEYDKIVAEKVKKGYQLVDGGDAEEAAPAAAKGGAKAAKAAPAPAGDGPRHFELEEGSSSKFWETWLEGGKLFTRFGKIGTPGQKNFKDYGSADEAATQRDRLIAEKVKKGYQESGGGAAASGPAKLKAASNPELEKSILENPDDDDAYLVYADWLQSQGDPRGELITIQHAIAKGDKKLAKEEKRLLAEHAFMPKKLGEMLALEKGRGDDAHRCKAEWRNGFLKLVRLSRSGEEDPHALSDLVAELFAHPSARFLVELQIGALGIYDEYDYGEVATAIVKARPAQLRKLTYAEYDSEDSELSWGHLGNLGKFWAAMPRLEEVTLHGGDMTVGTLDCPNLKSFRVITGGLDKGSIKSIIGAKWPRLESLHLYFGADDYGAAGNVKVITPILEGEGLPALKHLGLMNADFTDDICKALPTSKILKQLETLDLSLGTMSDIGAAALVEIKPAFKRLKELNVSENFLTKKGIAALKDLCPSVLAKGMKEPYDWDEDGRYVSVSE
jgi:uncharacterized protein (TIGR02996 family)